MKCSYKVNRKSLRRKATNQMAIGLFLIFAGVAAVECIPLGILLIAVGAALGYSGNKIEEELRK